MTTTTLTMGVRANPPMNYLGAPRVAFDPNVEKGTDEAAAAAAAKAEADAAAAAEAEAAQALAEAEAAAAADENNKDKADLVAEKQALLKDVMQKKAKLKETGDALAAAQAQLEAFKGIDPKKYAELVAKEQDAERADAEAKGDFDRVKKMMADQHAKEMAEKDAEIQRLRDASNGAAKVIDGLTIGNDFAGSKYIAENLTLSPTKARILYGSHFETKDGRTVAYDKPAGEANRTLLVNSSGDPLSFDEAFKKIVDADPDKNSVLKANIKPGSSGKTTDATADKSKKAGNDNVPYGRDLIARHFFKDDKR